MLMYEDYFGFAVLNTELKSPFTNWPRNIFNDRSRYNFVIIVYNKFVPPSMCALNIKTIICPFGI